MLICLLVCAAETDGPSLVLFLLAINLGFGERYSRPQVSSSYAASVAKNVNNLCLSTEFKC